MSPPHDANAHNATLSERLDHVHQVNVEAIASEHSVPLELDSYSLHWHDLQQGKFLALLALTGLGIRSVLYPAALVKVSRRLVHVLAEGVIVIQHCNISQCVKMLCQFSLISSF